MPVRLECPHCRSVLAVPSKFLGTTQSCPQCKGMFQAPTDAPPEARVRISESGELSGVFPAPATAPTGWLGSNRESSSDSPPATPPSKAGGSTLVPRVSTPGTQPPGTHSKPAAQANGWMTNKVARFISAETAAATIQPTPDGRLPALALEESETRKREPRDKAQKSWLLPVMLSVSVGLSLLMLVIDPGTSRSVLEKRADARQEIEQKFFHDPERCPSTSCRLLDTRFQADEGQHGRWTCDACGQRWEAAPPEPSAPPPPPRPYQLYLRRAQQAHLRGEYGDERWWYHRVLDLLRAEKQSERYELSVTGRPRGDEQLEKLISEVLSQ